jgi:hypothetical protein
MFFLEFHPRFFCIKDLESRNTLLKGSCRGGLYPLPASSCGKLAFGVNKVACTIIKPSIEGWYNRLGHPTIPIVQRVVRNFSLPCLAQQDLNSMCDACQQAKSHQLSYPKSTSVSNHPLELIFSNVLGGGGGAAPESFGRFKYYLSFIDDFSKFIWIYLLKFKFEVFQKFHEFEALVERFFDQKNLHPN